MFTEELRAARAALEAVDSDFDASCSGPDAVEAMEQLGAIYRLIDEVTALASKRVAETYAEVAHGDRNAS